MASANYATWYLVDVSGIASDGSHFKVCKTESERDAYIAELCEMFANMPVPNSDRPKINIRVDRHVRPNGPLM